MLPERISVKFFIDAPEAVNLPAFLPVFHGWIREKRVPGLLIDVADYKHVPDGPGVLLMGHEGDYALDGANGRFGLLYKQKREWQTDNIQERVRLVWQRASQAVSLLQAEPALNLAFRQDEVEITFPDRLNAPNTPETFAALQAELTAVLQELYQTAAIFLTQVSTDVRRPLTIQARLVPIEVGV